MKFSTWLAALTAKTTPVDADLLVLLDSEASNAPKKITKANLLAGAGGSGLYSAYVCIQDRKAQNTQGGTFTAAGWRTRPLTTESADTGTHASIASNQITLAAGTWRIMASAPAYNVNFHQARLYNISDTAVQQDTSGNDMYGTTEVAGSTTFATSRSIIAGRFTIADTKIFEIQHKCTTTNADDGFGSAGNLGPEIYTIVELWKEA